MRCAHTCAREAEGHIQTYSNLPIPIAFRSKTVNLGWYYSELKRGPAKLEALNYYKNNIERLQDDISMLQTTDPRVLAHVTVLRI
jgi:hypothetical protein